MSYTILTDALLAVNKYFSSDTVKAIRDNTTAVMVGDSTLPSTAIVQQYTSGDYVLNNANQRALPPTNHGGWQDRDVVKIDRDGTVLCVAQATTGSSGVISYTRLRYSDDDGASWSTIVQAQTSTTVATSTDTQAVSKDDLIMVQVFIDTNVSHIGEHGFYVCASNPSHVATDYNDIKLT